MEFFERVLAGETGKGLSFDKIFSHSVPLYIGVSEYVTGKPALLSPKNKTDLLRSIRASMSIPGAVTLPSIINNIRYVDGAASKPHVLDLAYNTLEATHVLIITNQDKGTKHISWLEHFVNNTFFRYRMTAPLRLATNWRREIRHEFVDMVFKASSKPTVFVWGDGSVSSKESDSILIQDTIEKSRQWWLELLR